MIRASTIAASVLGVLLGGGGAASAQIRAVGPGSTVAGDRLRGEGVYLQGLGWYELNAARARERDAETEKKLFDWNKQLYSDYTRERDAEIGRRKNLTKAQAEEARRRYEEREARLRTSPADDDIRRGDAPNALLADLSDPSIAESSWRFAQVPLPDDLAIKRLVFRFAAKSGAKGSQELGKAVIALGQLDVEGRWPGYFPANSMIAERRDYEAAYRTIRDQCLAGRLDSGAVLALDRAVGALKAKVGTAIPAERGYRASAVRFVADLEKSTRIFDASTYDYAREIISDTQAHEAKSVGELLAFMRKYRLMFAPAESRPEAFALYARLYDLLRRQAAALGLKGGEKPSAVAAGPVVGRWMHSAGGSRGVELEFRPEGTFERGGLIAGLWSQGEARTTLRWPSSNAKGGAFVDEVQLSADGRRYEGTNQFGKPIQGVRVDGARAETPAPRPFKDGLQPGRVWKGVGRWVYPADFPQAMTFELEITKRDGDEFEGVSKVNFGAHERLVKGTISRGRIEFVMTKLIKGKALTEPTVGTISGARMTQEIQYQDNGRRMLVRVYLKLVEQ